MFPGDNLSAKCIKTVTMLLLSFQLQIFLFLMHIDKGRSHYTLLLDIRLLVCSHNYDERDTDAVFRKIDRAQLKNLY